MNRSAGTFLLVLGIIVVVSSAIGAIAGLAKDQFELMIAGFIGLAVGVLFLIFGFYLRREKTASTPTDGRAGNYLRDAFETRSVGGLSYEVIYQTPVSGKNGRPSKLLVRVAVPTPTDLHFAPESRFDRLGKFLRIAKEVQTGDAEFDDAVYVRGLSDDYAAQFLTDADVRRAILTLFAQSFRAVRVTGSHLEAEWMSFKPETNDRPGLSDDVAAALGEMARHRPAGFTGEVPRDTTYWWCVLLWIASFAFAGTAASLYFFPPLRGWDLFYAGLRDFGWNYGLFVVLAGVVLRGTSIAHDRWFPLAFCGLGLVGIGTFGAMEAINALGDAGPIDERVVTIEMTRTQSGRHGSSYYASVPAWDRPGEQLEFSVSSSDFRRIVAHRSKMRLQIGPGRLGMPWVKGQDVMP